MRASVAHRNGLLVLSRVSHCVQDVLQIALSSTYSSQPSIDGDSFGLKEQ